MKTKKKKVLIISTVGLKYEGITSVILANLEAMKRDDLEIYLAGTIEVHPEIAEKITGLGCEIIDLPNRRTDTTAYFKALIRVIRRKKIDVVHAHGNSATMTIEMAAAFFGGCRRRIAHSHNTCCEQVRCYALSFICYVINIWHVVKRQENGFLETVRLRSLQMAEILKNINLIRRYEGR